MVLKNTEENKMLFQLLKIKFIFPDEVIKRSERVFLSAILIQKED